MSRNIIKNPETGSTRLATTKLLIVYREGEGIMACWKGTISHDVFITKNKTIIWNGGPLAAKDLKTVSWQKAVEENHKIIVNIVSKHLPKGKGFRVEYQITTREGFGSIKVNSEICGFDKEIISLNWNKEKQRHLDSGRVLDENDENDAKVLSLMHTPEFAALSESFPQLKTLGKIVYWNAPSNLKDLLRLDLLAPISEYFPDIKGIGSGTIIEQHASTIERHKKNLSQPVEQLVSQIINKMENAGIAYMMKNEKVKTRLMEALVKWSEYAAK